MTVSPRRYASILCRFTISPTVLSWRSSCDRRIAFLYTIEINADFSYILTYLKNKQPHDAVEIHAYVHVDPVNTVEVLVYADGLEDGRGEHAGRVEQTDPHGLIRRLEELDDLKERYTKNTGPRKMRWTRLIDKEGGRMRVSKRN